MKIQPEGNKVQSEVIIMNEERVEERIEERSEDRRFATPNFTEEQINLIRQAERKNKKGKKVKKVFAGIGIGLLVGVVAGVGFVGTTTVAKVILEKAKIVASDDSADSKEKGNKNKEDKKDTKKNKEESKYEEDSKPEVIEEVEEAETVDEAETAIPNTTVIDSDATQVDTAQAVIRGGMDVSQIVENAMPSIVSITNKSIQEVRSMFGGGVRQYESESAGSGIIIGQDSEELLVVTNDHVVEGANELTVGFIDEEIYSATVKGTDPDYDLAVVSIKIKDIKQDTLDKLRVAVIGDASALRVGEQVVAIGNAMGYGQSVTTGIVSALGRDLTDDKVDNPLIQTDAAINPGNSGGALLNMKGELIGINCAKIASTYIEGVGYAIPMDQATPIVETLMSRVAREKVEPSEAGYIGITGVSVDENTSKAYGIPVGVYIQTVEEDSPAEKAGLIKTDVVRKFDGITVSSINDIRDNLNYYTAGEKIKLEIYRVVDGEYVEKTIEVTLGGREGTSLDPNRETEEETDNSQEYNNYQDDYYDYFMDPFSIFGY